ncbi:MAG: Mth938-like domain-containing protein [Alphaproteobacteria bacterium]
MAIQPVVPADRQFIQSYGPGRFRISGVDHAGSVLVTPERTAPWPVAHFAALDEAAIDGVGRAVAGAEILLLGCGAMTELLLPALRQRFRAAGLVVDAMDTGAACRTYNVLAAEARRVAAALIALE